MASYSIPLQNGTYETSLNNVGQRGAHNTKFGHQLGIRLSDGSAITSGTLQIFCRGKGSGVFEEITDSPIDLTSITTPLFEFYVGDYRFVLSNISGTGRVRITDMEIE